MTSKRNHVYEHAHPCNKWCTKSGIVDSHNLRHADMQLRSPAGSVAHTRRAMPSRFVIFICIKVLQMVGEGALGRWSRHGKPWSFRLTMSPLFPSPNALVSGHRSGSPSVGLVWPSFLDVRLLQMETRPWKVIAFPVCIKWPVSPVLISAGPDGGDLNFVHVQVRLTTWLQLVALFTACLSAISPSGGQVYGFHTILSWKKGAWK